MYILPILLIALFIYLFRWGSGVPGEGVWGVQTPPRNSKDIGGGLDRTSKKNRHLDFLLQFTVFS